jgi:hypothetical protein
VNIGKNKKDMTKKTSKQCKGRWDSKRRKHLGERAHEDETRGTKSKWALFNKINDIMSSTSKITGLSNAIDNDEKSIARGSQKKKTP